MFANITCVPVHLSTCNTTNVNGNIHNEPQLLVIDCFKIYCLTFEDHITDCTDKHQPRRVFHIWDELTRASLLHPDSFDRSRY